MEEILTQIDRASSTGLYYVALMSALAVPDICGALEASDGKSTGARYIAWFDKWVAARYAHPDGRRHVDGTVCYRFRCGMLHQGTALIPRISTASRILFLKPSDGSALPDSPVSDTNFKRGLAWADGSVRMHDVVVYGGLTEGALVLDIGVFCRDITDAVRLWLKDVESNPDYVKNVTNSIALHPEGLAPYVRGCSVIG